MERICVENNVKPKYLISDQSVQFIAEEFRRWCKANIIKQRFGAIGTHGSIAVANFILYNNYFNCSRFGAKFRDFQGHPKLLDSHTFQNSWTTTVCANGNFRTLSSVFSLHLDVAEFIMYDNCFNYSRLGTKFRDLQRHPKIVNKRSEVLPIFVFI